MKVIIVGGVAAGAGAAARLRRLDEQAEIILLERGSYISFANCGLPYHLGGVIPERDSLLVMTPERFRARFAVDVRVENEAVAIDREARRITVRKADGSAYQESYDRLLLATGSSPLRMELPGGDDPAIHQLWTIPDMDRILAGVGKGAKRALVVGAGFIGLEVAENLRHRGLEVTVVELAPQVLPTVDKEMSVPLAAELAELGITLELGHKVVAFRRDGALFAKLEDGRELEADFAVMSVGVRPNSELAKAAGLELGPRGHIVTDEFLRTSDPAIYAAGDVVEVADPVTGGRTAIPLAGPANKQGRIAADNLAGRSSRYPGSFGAAILKIGSLAAGSVGLTERRLTQLKLDYRKIYLHAASSAGYYPGGAMLDMKLLFAPDGKILGAQIVGRKGVDKRIDVIATAMRDGVAAPALAELELAYAPPFNTAKDPVNLAGMIAGNVLDGTSRILHADAVPAGMFLLDVREVAEFENGTIPGAVNIPLGELRTRLGELDKSRPLAVFCRVGQRGYVAERILRQHGFDVYNLSGGYLTWQQFHAETPKPVRTAAAPEAPANDSGEAEVVDARALACPGPVVRLKQKVDVLEPGGAVKLLAPLSFAPDLAGWIQSSGNTLVSLEKKEEFLEAVIRKAGAGNVAAAAETPGGHGCSMVLFSNDLDKAMAALIIACGMAASGAKVGIFFTFWGLSVLRKNPAPAVEKTLVAKLFGWMLPKGARKLSLSKMNMGGMGTAMMKHVMAEQHVTTLPELLRQARELGVRFVACEMAMDVMGITREELIEVDEVAGVASFVAMAKHSNNTLFI